MARPQLLQWLLLPVLSLVKVTRQVCRILERGEHFEALAVISLGIVGHAERIE